MSAAKPESPSLTPRTRMVERTGSHKLSSDPHTTRAVACIGVFTHAFVRA